MNKKQAIKICEFIEEWVSSLIIFPFLIFSCILTIIFYSHSNNFLLSISPLTIIFLLVSFGLYFKNKLEKEFELDTSFMYM